MTEQLKSPVRATPEPRLLERSWDEGTTFAPGAFAFEEPGGTDRRMWFVCPTGCGQISGIRVTQKGDPPQAKTEPTWEWDGDLENPTLAPSIHQVGHWHGFLRKGVWVDA